MVPPEPPIERLDLAAARRQWARLLARVRQRQARVLLEHNGVPLAALVHPDDLARLAQLDAERAVDFQALDAARAAFADVPDAELEREVAKAIAAVRAQRRQAVPLTGA
ncbi:MAG TPA: hypothetical protein VKZ60_07710 [Chloroflexota bacterium]|jgi:multidrug resistance efflux pump|nr:hypothetical protein [Chloroflexota bacterium]